MLVQFLAKHGQATVRFCNVLCRIGILRLAHLRSVIFRGHAFILTPYSQRGKAAAAMGSGSVPILQ